MSDEHGALQTPAERHTVIALAVLQGILLLLLHEGLDAGWTWLDPPGATLALYASAVGGPIAAMLSVGGLPPARVGAIGAGFTLVMAATAAWFGYQGDGGEHARWAGTFAWIPLALIGGYVALPLAQVAAEGGRPRLPYPRLYFRAWQNGLLLVLAGGFTGVFWLILFLWAALFNLIGIDFFGELFTSRRFAWPVSGLVFGLGLTLFSGLDRVVAVKRRLLITTTKSLEPILGGVALLFIAFLPVMGLTPLWESGVAARLLLVLATANILFVGSTWADGDTPPPWPAPLRLLVHAALWSTPVYAALAGWAIALRVDQYGWTDARLFGAATAIVIALYSLGYAASATRLRGERWMPGLGPVNTAGAFVIVVVCVTLSSPLIDVRAIPVSDQAQRLRNGTVDVGTFDFNWLRFDGGRPGRAALQRLALIEEHPESERIRALAETTLEKEHRRGSMGVGINDADALRAAIPAPNGVDAPRAFWNFLLERVDRYPERTCFSGDGTSQCTLITTDLDADGDAEYALMLDSCKGRLYDTRDGVWTLAGSLKPADSCHGGDVPVEAFRGRLEAGDTETRPPRWRRLRIGPQVYDLSGR